MSGTGEALIGKYEYQSSKRKKTCSFCGESGRFFKDCPKNLHQKPLKSKHKVKSAYMVSQGESHSDSESDEKVFGASSQSYNSHDWIVDSGASSHMAQVRGFLVNYEEFDNPQKVSMGDGRTVEAHGRGNIHFKMILENNMQRKVTMYSVLYVPKLTCNLFSVRATVTMGNTVKFENGSCRIYDRNGLLLGTGRQALLSEI